MPLMQAPDSGVRVRMYRTGHGDCFLLAFRDDDGEPFYMLIDCGYKPGSNVHHSIDEIVDDIAESTGGRIHVVVITHEHQDHVNGFWNKFGANEKRYFENIDIGHLWLAWTEDPNDDLANDLRQRYGDTLLGLMAAAERLGATEDPLDRRAAARIDALLGFEIEGERDEFLGLAIAGVTNKRAIKFIKDKSERSPLYLRPHGRSYWLPNVAGVRLFVLGPPRDEGQLLSLDPEGSEGYKYAMALAPEAGAFFSAALDHATDPAFGEKLGDAAQRSQPFAPRFRIHEDGVDESEHAEFFREHYESEDWRTIATDWLHSAETFALRLNGEVNNTSVVLAIELPATRKVLLFSGDAQRGNWISWDDATWTGDPGEEITARDLLGRTVLYKVGHHGSHNATLKGLASSDYANLNWMASGEHRDEFVAMIPANRPWAYDTADWKHPLRSIEQALIRKAKGRVFRTDVDHVSRRAGISDAEWQEFQSRTRETTHYFEYTVGD